MSKSDWTFEWMKRECRKLLASYDYKKELSEFASVSTMHPVVLAGALKSTISPALELSAVLHSASGGKLAESWIALHLSWRMRAIAAKTFIDYRTHLLKLKSLGILPRGQTIRNVTCMDYNDLAMLGAQAEVLAIEDASNCFCQKCIQLAASPDSKCTPDMLTAGPVEPFMLNLFLKKTGSKSIASFTTEHVNSPFARIIENWQEDITLPLSEVLDLKARKIRHHQKLDNDLVFGLQDGLNFVGPFEILYLQRIRQLQGLTSDLPSHPLLQVPLANIGRLLPCSGFNTLIADTLTACKSVFPELSIPWEDRFQQLPATETDDYIAET